MQIAPIHGPGLDARVWRWIEAEVLDADALAIGLRQYQERAEAAQAEVRRQLVLLEQQRAQIQGQIDRLLDLYLTDGIDRLRYDARRAELTAVSESLMREIQAMATQTADLTDEEIAALQGFARAIREELRDLTMEERRRVIDMLDVRVTIVLEGDAPVAHVRCRLAPGAIPLPINTPAPPNWLYPYQVGNGNGRRICYASPVARIAVHYECAAYVPTSLSLTGTSAGSVMLSIVVALT